MINKGATTDDSSEYEWVHYAPSPVIECGVCSFSYSGQAREARVLTPHGVGTLGSSGITHSGTFSMGRRHGQGVTTLSRDDLQVIGDWTDDEVNGEGEIVVEDGPLLLSCYKGPMVNTLPDTAGGTSPGFEIYKDGSYYVGQFDEGLKHGEGRLYDGRTGRLIYHGEWETGYVKWYCDGEQRHVYVGYVERGRPHLYGRMYEVVGELPDRQGMEAIPLALRYEGQWNMGRPDGYGVAYDKEGVYDGYYVRGLKWGLGTYTPRNAASGISGQWEQDRLARAFEQAGNVPRHSRVLFVNELVFQLIEEASAVRAAINSHRAKFGGLWAKHLKVCLGEPAISRRPTMAAEHLNVGRSLLVIVQQVEGSFKPKSAYKCVISYGQEKRETRSVLGDRLAWNEMVSFPLEGPSEAPELYLQVKEQRGPIVAAGIHYLWQTPLINDSGLGDFEGLGERIADGHAKAALIGKDPDTGMKVHIGRIHLRIIITSSALNHEDFSSTVSGSTQATPQKKVIAANIDLVQRLESILAKPKA